ncbi:hypothetical protein [Nostoc sp.]
MTEEGYETLRERLEQVRERHERQPFVEKRLVVRHLNFGDSALFR